MKDNSNKKLTEINNDLIKNLSSPSPSSPTLIRKSLTSMETCQETETLRLEVSDLKQKLKKCSETMEKL
jgi:hypothetical protein